MTLGEKISLLQFDQPAIPRLGMEKYYWWNEALHGVARNGIATVFPQAIGMAATWNTGLIEKEADVISTEARAKYNAVKGPHSIYQGLTFWSPNINIFRDPRWGRGQETYGEDPFLTASAGVAFVEGLQGNDPHYLKVAATAKHFAVHSGPESGRHNFDVWPTDRDLYETYLPAFEALVKTARVEAVMGAYNLFRGLPCNANPFLLDTLLRQKWGFRGHVVSDCWALTDMVHPQQTYRSEPMAAARSLDAGLDISCGPELGTLQKALDSGWVRSSQIDTALSYILATRFRLGMFDPDSLVPYSRISPSLNDAPAHDSLAKRVAMESIVLLQNRKQTLPLLFSGRTIAVIGALADDTSVLVGNYHGEPSHPVTILRGIAEESSGRNTVVYCMGTKKPWQHYNSENELNDSMARAVTLARKADVVIIVAGITARLEGEEGDVAGEIRGFYKGDRTSLDLPSDQQKLIRSLSAAGKPVVLVLVNGSALSVSAQLSQVQSVLEAWYPGQEGGRAVASVLFGKYNPAGRLPVTFYHSVKDLPAFSDYHMKGRTYRYYHGKPLFAFGYGLSYTKFTYGSLQVSSRINRDDSVLISVTVKNTGNYGGDEVVQLYVRKEDASKEDAIKSLQGFQRLFIPKGGTRTIRIPLKMAQLRHYDEEKKDYAVAPGKYEIQIGASSDDIRLRQIIEVTE
jgi:beta-glucosidase